MPNVATLPETRLRVRTTSLLSLPKRPPLYTPPPRVPALLPDTVLLIRLITPLVLNMPPPSLTAVLPDTVLFVRFTRLLKLRIPPAVKALLPETVLLVRVTWL